jgi:serine/threonine-protein kinase
MDAFPAGTVLAGKYRIERQLGAGGMGIVLAATHLRLEERVAIKVLLPRLAANEEIVARFLREARAAARIRSEHVARAYDVETLEDGTPYIVMEYLEGKDLEQLIAVDGPFPPTRAIDYLLQACEALAEAHSLGIIHRDLKPPNLFRTKKPDGTSCIKVLDFGIAKVAGAVEESMGMTKTNTQMGTPLYMAPEQLRSSRNVDVRADIWALGAVLHELVIGKPPFPADSLADLAVAVATQPTPSLRKLRPDISLELDRVIWRCLQVDPEARFASVADLAKALAPFGTSAGKASAERVARVLAPVDSGPAGSVVPPPSSDRPLGHTAGAWDHAERSATTRRSIALYGLGAVATIAIVATTVAKLGGPAPPAAGSGGSTSSSTSATSASAPSATWTSATPSAPPALTPTSTPVHSASAVTPPPRRMPQPARGDSRPPLASDDFRSPSPKPSPAPVVKPTTQPASPKPNALPDLH